MNKLLTLILASFVLVPLAAAQDGIVAVNAEVVDALNWSINVPADFGQLPVGAGTVTLNPQDGSTNAGAGATAAGEAQIQGSAGSEVQVSFTSTDLTYGGNSLTFTPSVHAADAQAGQGAAPQFSSGNTVTLNGSGDYYFFVGGDLEVNGGATTGTYSGTVTLTASYTGS